MDRISAGIIKKCQQDEWFGGEEWNDTGFSDYGALSKIVSTGFEHLPAKAEQVAAAERELGFPLPSLLTTVLTEVANGGFGPGYGLFGVARGKTSGSDDLVTDYSVRRGDQKVWPAGWLPICSFGCDIVSAVQASTSRVVRFLGDPAVFCLEAASLHEWFQAWIDGEKMFDRVSSDLFDPFRA